jgi:flagellar biosynthesis protein FliR
MVVSELSLGLLLGIIPQLIVSATHLAGSLASTAMGLGASQLFDPTLGEQSTSVGKLYSDLGVIIFLLINGHHTVIAAASGLANTLPAGVFSPSTQFVLQLTGATSIIFKLGLIISAPIVSTLLITQFILGVLSKTVPSINVFFISFPVTVAIGLTLAAASLPSVVVVLEKGFIDICQLLLNSLN